MKILATLFLVLALAACDSGEPKEVCVVQQFSPALGKWEDVILVFGFWSNFDEAQLIAQHYTGINKERSYRVINKRVTRREYKNLRSQLESQ